MALANEARKGMTIRLEGEIYKVVDFKHVKLGRGGAFVRLKLKNISTGAVIEKTFQSDQVVEDIPVELRRAEYLYHDGESYFFMDTETYEQIELKKSQIEESLPYLVENMEVHVMLAMGKPCGIQLPTFCVLKVVETDPGVRGDTVSGGSKPAILETGLKISVPLFTQVGDKVKVDTRTGKYVERVTE